MDEQKQSEQPPKYVWPKFVLAGVVLGIVLAVFWMAVLVHRVSQQREDMVWPTNAVQPVQPVPTQSTNTAPVVTNTTPAH